MASLKATNTVERKLLNNPQDAMAPIIELMDALDSLWGTLNPLSDDLCDLRGVNGEDPEHYDEGGHAKALAYAQYCAIRTLRKDKTQIQEGMARVRSALTKSNLNRM